MDLESYKLSFPMKYEAQTYFKPLAYSTSPLQVTSEACCEYVLLQLDNK